MLAALVAAQLAGRAFEQRLQPVERLAQGPQFHGSNCLAAFEDPEVFAYSSQDRFVGQC